MHSDETISDFFRILTEDRERGIDHIIATDPDCPHRLMAAVKWDTEHAPKCTNWAMLKIVGVDPSIDSIFDIINGLAKWNIYLTDTNHLTDEELRSRLLTSILIEEVTMIPPNPDMTEFICMIRQIPGEDGVHLPEKTKPVCNRDDTLPRPAHRDPSLSPNDIDWINQILS